MIRNKKEKVLQYLRDKKWRTPEDVRKYLCTITRQNSYLNNLLKEGLVERRSSIKHTKSLTGTLKHHNPEFKITEKGLSSLTN